MEEAEPPPDLRTHTRSGVEREEVWRLASRPAWSIRSRRGALAPFLDLIRSLFRRRR